LTVNTFVKDGQGGFAMLWGSGTTKPGGHYEKITNLQQGLKNDIAEYKRLCSNNGGWPPVPRTIDDSANRKCTGAGVSDAGRYTQSKDSDKRPVMVICRC
jgi:hypothetical protein